MTTALQDLLEYAKAKNILHFVSPLDFVDKINSLMQKDRETHIEMFSEGSKCEFGIKYGDFEKTFPTHPTNKPA